jgi:hypothetical protein
MPVNAPEDGQKGQVLPLLALMMVAVIGIIALAVDFGFVANQHRNLQEFADNAAMAGASQLTAGALSGGASSVTAAQQAGRQEAFTVLRDSIFGSNGSSVVPFSALSSSSCWNSSGTLFATDIKGCQMPGGAQSYVVTICAPGETSGVASSYCATQETIAPVQTLSVRLVETVALSFERMVGVSNTNAGAYAEARFQAPTGNGSNTAAGGRLGFSLYSNGCVTTGNNLEVIGGDVYINQCTLTVQSSGQAGFCALGAGATAGNINMGPDATYPSSTPNVNVTSANCQSASHGAIDATGSFNQLTTAIPIPKYVPPPGYSSFNATPSSPYPNAVANNLCLNGTSGSNCFNPGYYSTITGISNNLNPGVYYITGDPACTTSSTTTNCTGVQFSGPTLNINYQDVKDRCWASPNVPANSTYVAPCPDGLIFDPSSFPNVPSSSDPSQNFGVTFVLINKAGLDGNGVASIALSPFCSTFRDLPVNPPDVKVPLPTGVSRGTGCEPPYAQSGAYLNDGAFAVYGPTTGIITPGGNPGAYLEVSGTVYAPSATLSSANLSPFAIVPGQAIVNQTLIQSGNHPNPAFYYPCCSSSTTYGGFTGARESSVIQLIR